MNAGFYTTGNNPFEYIQMDFGTCNLTFSQFMIIGQGSSYATYIEGVSNIEVDQIVISTMRKFYTLIYL